MQLLALTVALGFAVACDIVDIALTEKGIRKGVAVEANDWLVGQKPSMLALYLRDSLVLFLATLPAIVAIAVHNSPVFWGALLGPAIVGIKHIRGGRMWRTLLNGGTLPPAPKTAWQKFIRG